MTRTPLIIAAIAILGLGLSACEQKKGPSATANTPKAGASKAGASKTPPSSIKPDPASTAKLPPKAEDLARYTSDLKGSGKLGVTITTELGAFKCTLFGDIAPMTVANFVGLGRGLKAWTDPKTREAQVGKPLYPGTIFHRVIPGFMIQGGDPLGVGRGNPGYRFGNETSPKARHDRPGLLSMANAGPGTNGSQFFITEVPTPHLDGKHTVFGQCDNLALVKKIANARGQKFSILSMDFYKGTPPK